MNGLCSDGLGFYYKNKIERYEAQLAEKTQNLRRLEAQRNLLNSKGNAVD
jgi:26S proteasome regulatory subunit T6